MPDLLNHSRHALARVRRTGAAATDSWPGALTAILALAFCVVAPAFAHGEQIAVKGGAKGPVTLAAAQQKALGLTLATASERPVPELLYLNGEVRPVAGRQAEANSRSPGRITAVYATLGQVVRAGQKLARVQSRLVGDPPPSVDIVASMAGLLERVDAKVGQSVEPGTPLFGLRDSRDLRVVARVYEEDLAKVQPGQAASLTFLSFPGRDFSGRIALVGPSLDPESRTVDVFVDVDNSAGLLKPNLFARVAVVLRENAQALALPDATIIEAGGETFVFLAHGNRFERVDIDAGARMGGYTEIRSGLVPGDKVVLQGNRQVYTVWLTGDAPLKSEDD